MIIYVDPDQNPGTVIYLYTHAVLAISLLDLNCNSYQKGALVAGYITISVLVHDAVLGIFEALFDGLMLGIKEFISLSCKAIAVSYSNASMASFLTTFGYAVVFGLLVAACSSYFHQQRAFNYEPYI